MKVNYEVDQARLQLILCLPLHWEHSSPQTPSYLRNAAPYQPRPNLTKWKALIMWESGRKWSKIFKKKNRNLNQVLSVRSLKHTLKGSFFKHVECATGRYPTREHALGSWQHDQGRGRAGDTRGVCGPSTPLGWGFRNIHTGKPDLHSRSHALGEAHLPHQAQPHLGFPGKEQRTRIIPGHPKLNSTRPLQRGRLP